MDAEEILNAFYGQVAFTRGPKGWSRPFDPDAFRGLKLSEPLVDARTGEVVADKDAKLTPRAARKIAEGGTTEVLVGRADLLGRFVAEDLVDTQHRRDLGGGRRGADRAEARRDRAGRARPAADAGDRPVGRALDAQHAGGGQEHQPRRRADGHLPGDAPGRAADAGDGGDAVPRPVLRPRALRPLGRRPGEDEHAPGLLRRGGAGHHPHAAQAGHRGDDARAAGAEGRARPDRRHRQPRQPPGALGRRADGEPVPRRPAAHGARDQGAHGVGRYRHRDAARPDQREAGGGGGAGVLRLLAALAVHGPDQPAVRGDAQAPPLGARSGRPDARARRLRGARRAPDALRPHLPDRDAGRAEYRPHQLARHLRQGEQVRLHRDAVPPGAGTARSCGEPRYLSAMEEERLVVAQADANDGRDRRLQATSWSRCARAATSGW